MTMTQNIQPIERAYSTCYEYKVGSLYSFCIKLPYERIQFHAKAKGGGGFSNIHTKTFFRHYQSWNYISKYYNFTLPYFSPT